MKLWFVDDRPENHATWRNSFSSDINSSCDLRVFLSIDELLDVLSGGQLPDMLFLDFFVSGRLGSEVIKWFEDQPVRPLLIAHSSMELANIGMVEAGADFYLEKVKGRSYTESIRATFQTMEEHREHHRESKPAERTVTGGQTLESGCSMTSPGTTSVCRSSHS